MLPLGLIIVGVLFLLVGIFLFLKEQKKLLIKNCKESINRYGGREQQDRLQLRQVVEIPQRQIQFRPPQFRQFQPEEILLGDQIEEVMIDIPEDIDMVEIVNALEGNMQEFIHGLFRERGRGGDSQNVHDTAVSSHASNILDIIRKPEDRSVIDEIKKFSETYRGKSPKFEKSMEYISKNWTSYHSKLRSTLGAVITSVWYRTKMSENKVNKRLMQEAIIDNLEDCIDKSNKPVCLSGFMMRIIQSLVLLDFDKRTWDMQHSTDYKNEIIKMAQDCLNDIAQKEINNNTSLKKVAESWIDPNFDEEVKDSDNHKFIILVRKELEKRATKYCNDLNAKIPGCILEKTKNKFIDEAMKAFEL